MKMVSKFALAFALGAMTFAPAAQAMREKKDEKKAAEASQPKLSKGFHLAYGPAVNHLTKTLDFQAARAAWPAARAAIENDDDKYQAGIFAIQLAGKLQDKDLEADGFNLLLSSNFTPRKVKGSILFQTAAKSYDAREFAAAAPKMIEAYNFGHRVDNIEFLISNAFAEQQKYGEAIGWLQRAMDADAAAGKPPAGAYRKLTGGNYIKLNDFPSANKWLKEAVLIEPSPINWYDMLNVYMSKGNNANLSDPETLDVLRLMRANKALKTSREYLLYIIALNPLYYPVEVVSLVDEGVKLGAISLSDPDISGYYSAASKVADEDRRTLPAQEAEARSSRSGNLILRTADSFYAQDKFETAKELYELALSKDSIIDSDGNDQRETAQMRLAMSKLALNDLAGAKAEFAKITDGQRKVISDYWMIYVDQKAKAANPAG